MEELNINGTKLKVKDYYCRLSGSEDEYVKKEKPKLWLYVNVTDSCNAKCPFCVAKANSNYCTQFDKDKYFNILNEIKDYIYGISFTGGEPTLYLELLGDLVEGTVNIVSNDIEIDMVTNGTNLIELSKCEWIKYFTTIHISRHFVDDEVNARLMGLNHSYAADIKYFIDNIEDKGKVVLNCVMQKAGVKSMSDVDDFLEFSALLGVENTSFITMFNANKYCEDNYVSSLDFPIMNDIKLKQYNKNKDVHYNIWNRQNDHSYCSCCSGSFYSTKAKTRFYFRCPGTKNNADYCRQLVYTSDNHLQDGFGENRKILY